MNTNVHVYTKSTRHVKNRFSHRFKKYNERKDTQNAFFSETFYNYEKTKNNEKCFMKNERIFNT